MSHTGAPAPINMRKSIQSDLPARSPVKLTHSGEQLAEFDVAKREVVHWKSSDGTAIEGILYKPKDSDARKNIRCWLSFTAGLPASMCRPSIRTAIIRSNDSSRKERWYCVRTTAARQGTAISSALNVRTGSRRLCGCDFGRGLIDRAGIRRQRPGGVHGMERGRVYLSFHHRVE